MHKKSPKILNTAILCILVLSIGFSNFFPVFAQEEMERKNEETMIINEPQEDTVSTTREKEILTEENNNADDNVEKTNEDSKTSDEEKQEYQTEAAIANNDSSFTPKGFNNPLTGLKGLSGNFDTDLFSGAGSFSLPLQVPKGRNGIQPSLNLQYSSMNSRMDGNVGYGWEIPVGSIFRSTNKGSDKLYDVPEFTAQIFGKTEELILIDTVNNLYAPKVESSFTQYSFSQNSWTAVDSRGTKYIFGAQDQSKQFDASNAQNVYKWMLEKIEDTNGNSMSFWYLKDQNQIYPQSIQYTEYGNNAPAFKISFQYSEKPASITQYTTNFKVTTNKILSFLHIESQNGSGFETRYSYKFTYTQLGVLQLLESVQMMSGLETLPPIRFSYTGEESSKFKPNNTLQKIISPFGAITTIEYQLSTSYKNAQSQIANQKLHVPIKTVYKVSQKLSEAEAPLVTTYQYENGIYYFDVLDSYTREYVGFGMVKITDPVGNVQKIFFHQSEFSEDNAVNTLIGEFEDHISKKGKMYREETYDNAGKLFTKKIQTWDKRELPSSYLTWKRYFPFLQQTIIADYDGNSTHKAIAETFSHDDYGNVKEHIQYGEVSLTSETGNFSDIGNDGSKTTYEYITPVSNLSLVSFPKRELMLSMSNATMGETKTYYDNLPFGEISKGNVTKVEQRVSNSPLVYAVSETSYNNFGMPVSFKNPRGYITTVVYDSLNLYPVSLKNAKNQTTQFTYDPVFGNVMSSTDPNGKQEAYEYDGFGRGKKVQMSDPQNAGNLKTLASYIYDTQDNPQSVTETKYIEDGNIETLSRVYFDNLGRISQTRKEVEGNNQFVVESKIYDERGNVKKEFLPVFASGIEYQVPTMSNLGTEYQYDALSRVKSIINSLGTATITYDQWEQKMTDPNGKKKDLIFNAFKSLRAVREYISGQTFTTSYTFDALQNVTKITDAKGNVRNMSYNLMKNRLTLQDLHTSADTTFGTWRFTYDLNGNLLSKTDPKAQVVNFTYDELDRMLTENFTGATGVESSYIYDQGANGIGKLSQVVTNAVTKNFTYDLLGRITEERKNIQGTEYLTQFAYDMQGNLKTLTYPDTTLVNYTYNQAGLLENIKKEDNSVLLENMDMAPNAMPQTLVFGNGVITTNTYDISKLWRMTNKKTLKNSVKLQDNAYLYDPVGNILSITDTSNTNTAKTSTFAYDDLYRLTSASVTNAVNNQNYIHTYTYDILGNILNRSDTGNYVYAGADSATSDATTANPHAATTINNINYTYDKNGNLLSNGTWTHTWNYQDRIASSTNGTITVTYTYDEAGQRVSKTTNPNNRKTVYVNQYYAIEDNAPKKFYYAGDMKIATETEVEESLGNSEQQESLTGSGSVLAGPSMEELTGSGSMLGSEDNESANLASGISIIFHHADHLSGASVDTDIQGNILELIDYYPYGNIRLDEQVTGYENDYKFTGKELDEDTNLSYYEARYYDASIGRFISIDPWFGDLSDPQSLNKYAYVRNNPLKYVDPTGKTPDLITDPLFLAYDAITALYQTGQMLGGAAAYVAGAVTNNDTLKAIAVEGMKETAGKLADTGLNSAFDVGAAAIPFVPAGATHIDDGVKILQKTQKFIGSLKNKISGYAKHGLDQKITREVKSKDIWETMKNPLEIKDIKIDPQGRKSQRFIGEKAEVVKNPETHQIISVNPTSSKEKQRLLRKRSKN